MDIPSTDSTDNNHLSPTTENISMREMLYDNRTLTTPDVRRVANELISTHNLEDPFYVCDIGELIKKHAEWLTNLPRVRPFYAVKCNDCPLVLETLAGLGCGFDCASKVEMRNIVDIGVSPSRDIIYANPAKPRSHICAAAEFGVEMVTFDSETEIYKLKHYLPGAKLIVRLRIDSKAQCPLGMKFGVTVEEAKRLLSIAKDLGMDVAGVSFHVGSGCSEPFAFFKAIESAKLIFDFAAEKIGYDFNLLDIGGGMTSSSFLEVSRVVNNALEQFFPEGCGVEIIAEPGRFFVASAFTLFTQIHSIREKDDHIMYFINDGIYGSFNCIMFDHAVVQPEVLDSRKKPEMESSELFESSLWGSTCDGLDQVCSREFLPKMEIGEWLMWRSMGAYTLVAASRFNGFPTPKVFYWSNDIGYNRDCVGWNSNCAQLAIGGYFSDEDGQSSTSASSSY